MSFCISIKQFQIIQADEEDVVKIVVLVVSAVVS